MRRILRQDSGAWQRQGHSCRASQQTPTGNGISEEKKSLSFSFSGSPRSNEPSVTRTRLETLRNPCCGVSLTDGARVTPITSQFSGGSMAQPQRSEVTSLGGGVAKASGGASTSTPPPLAPPCCWMHHSMMHHLQNTGTGEEGDTIWDSYVFLIGEVK